jgi:dTDP-4-dehydrorhamnose reductase
VKILLIGARGQLAQDIIQMAAKLGHDEVVPVTHEQLDIRDAGQVAACIGQARPDCVINTAAFHKVDLCEDEPEHAFAVNEGGVRNVARAAQQGLALLVQFSTDYVFDGARGTAYVESDDPKPLSVYGRSRLAGERAVESACERYLIVRTCGLYGLAGSTSKAGNFVETMLHLAEGGKKLKVVNDQVCTPTSTSDLAQHLLPLVRSGAQGTFHLTNTGECSWFEFAQQIFRSAKTPAQLEACSTQQFGAKAPRPAYSVLDNRAYRAAGFEDFRPWHEALEEYISCRSVRASSAP